MTALNPAPTAAEAEEEAMANEARADARATTAAVTATFRVTAPSHDRVEVEEVATVSEAAVETVHATTVARLDICPVTAPTRPSLPVATR